CARNYYGSIWYFDVW
nr:immunoglobulin heavy chain junction region [Mus musculus]